MGLFEGDKLLIVKDVLSSVEIEEGVRIRT